MTDKAEQDRQEFEKKFRAVWCNYVNPFACFPSGVYVDGFVSGHWQMWQARSAQVAELRRRIKALERKYKVTKDPETGQITDKYGD